MLSKVIKLREKWFETPKSFSDVGIWVIPFFLMFCHLQTLPGLRDICSFVHSAVKLIFQKEEKPWRSIFQTWQKPNDLKSYFTFTVYQLHGLYTCTIWCCLHEINNKFPHFCKINWTTGGLMHWQIFSLLCRISLDEGKKWDRHSFSLVPLYVDGVLMEPESDNHIIT